MASTKKPSESMIGVEYERMGVAMKAVMESLRVLNEEQRIRVIAAASIFFNVGPDVIERIERGRG